MSLATSANHFKKGGGIEMDMCGSQVTANERVARVLSCSMDTCQNNTLSVFSRGSLASEAARKLTKFLWVVNWLGIRTYVTEAKLLH